MDYQTILFFFMQIVFIAYVAFIWIKYGIQKSISESYYILPRKLNPLFTFFCWGFAIPAIILGGSGVMFLAGSGIAFVGAAAAMHEKMTRKVHLTGAIGGIIASQLAIIFQYDLWWISVIGFALAGIVLLIDKKHAMWWTELIAFISIGIAIASSIF